MSTVGPYGDGQFGTSVYSTLPFWTTSTLIDAVLLQTGHSNPATQGEKRTLALQFINMAYAEICSNRHWNFMFSQTEINFEAPVMDGTVSVDLGSQTVTGTGTSWTANLKPGRMLAVKSGANAVYSVEDIPAANQLTISAQFSDANVTGAGYSILKGIYELPADVEAILGVQLSGYYKMLPTGEQQMTVISGRNPTLQGLPQWYTQFTRRAQDGVLYMSVYPYPDKAYQVIIDYQVQLLRLVDNEDSWPLVPDKYRDVLLYSALSQMYTYMRNTDGAALADQAYKRRYLQMCGDTELTDSKLVLSPQRGWSMARRRRYRTSYDRQSFSIFDDDGFGNGFG